MLHEFRNGMLCEQTNFNTVLLQNIENCKFICSSH